MTTYATGHWRSWILASVLVLSPAGLLRADAIDDAVTALMAKRKIPGLSLAVIEDGAIVKARGYGLSAVDYGVSANLAEPRIGKPGGKESPLPGRPVTPDTLFQAGGISQAVTALGVLHLAESRRVSLDEDINRTLMAWGVPSNTLTRDQKVTLRRLLSHSAGVTVAGFPGYMKGVNVPTLQQALDGERPAKTPPVRVDVVPGSKWRYSAGGFAILQQWAQDISGHDFPEFMRQTVFEPLQMVASTYVQRLSAERVSLAATGHAAVGRPVEGGWQVYPELAAAGLWSTPSDLARFAIGVQRGFAGRANPVVSQAVTRAMLTPQMAEAGLGVFLSGTGDTLRFDHGGRTAGFDAQMVAYAGRGQGAVIMINTNDNSGTMSRVLEAIADAYDWPDYPRIQPAAPIEDQEPAVTAKVRQIFEMAQAGRVDRRIYTLGLAETISRQLGEGLATELKSYGALQSIALIGRRNAGDNREFRYRIVFEHESLLVTCTFFADGRIGELSFGLE